MAVSIKTSPFISLTGATENRRSHARDVKLPQLVRAAGFYPDPSTGLLATPPPSFTFPTADTIPSTPVRSSLSDENLTIAAAGSGYAVDSATVSGGGGSGAELQLIVNGSGGIVGVTITDPGTGYTSAPTVSLATGSGGSITVSNWTISTYTAFIQIAGYVVLLKADNTSRKIRWCAPGRTSVWDQYEVDGDIFVETGAGTTTLKGSGALENGLALGSLGVIFDANGIGVLALTGDLIAPFTYAQTLNQTTAESQVRVVDGVGYFVGYDGRIWRTTGYSMSPIDGPFDLDKITEITWPPATAIQFAHNSATQNWVVYDGTTYAYISRESGAYATSASTKYFTTGALPLESENERVHIQRVRLYTQISGTFSGNCTVVVSSKGVLDTSWHDSAAVDIGTTSTAGDYETTIEVNDTRTLPQLKFTFTVPTGATLRPQGIVLLYETGGLR